MTAGEAGPGFRRRRVLVLDGDSNAGRAVLQSLGRRGHECWVASATPHPTAFASRHAARKLVYPDPLHDKARFQEWLRTLQAATPCDLIVPGTEMTLVPVHEMRSEPAIAAAALLPPPAAVDAALDKSVLLAAATALGIPAPRTQVFPAGSTLTAAALANAIESYPVVLKPARSKLWLGERGTSLHVRIARDAAQAALHLQYLLPLVPVLVQEWVPGTGLGVEVLAQNGRLLEVFGHQRLHEVPLTGGASSYRQSIVPAPELRDAAARLIAHLEWDGAAMVEFRVDPSTGRFWLMEVNGRLWGSLPLAIFAGADFPAALVELKCGHEPRPFALRPAPVYARQIAGEVEWMKAALRGRRHPDPLVRLPRLVTSALEWARLCTGREIWDGWAAEDPRPLLLEVWRTKWRFWRTLLASLRRQRLARAVRRAAAVRLLSLHGSRKLLVLCYGNICRSPYAAAQLQRAAAGYGLEVRSAGFSSRAGRPMPEIHQRLAAARGIDLEAHRSVQVDRAALDWAELIVVMDAANERELALLDAGALERTLRLGALDPEGGDEIRDPYRLPAEEIAGTFAAVDRAAAALVAGLCGGGPSGRAHDTP